MPDNAADHHLSLMTVFLPREEIFFVEEWLQYHIAMGVGHFYLYNNAGSQAYRVGNGLLMTGKNKRGQEIFALLADKDDATVQAELDQILAPFVARGLVTQITWQPRDAEGAITYGQVAAFFDYIRRFAARSTWTLFTDMDEFLFPARHTSITDVIADFERQGVTYVRLAQRYFASRFTDAGEPVPSVLAITRCSADVSDRMGPKTLVKSDTLLLPDTEDGYSIHAPAADPARTRMLNSDLLRFNHYKFNQWELDWATEYFGRPIRLDQHDEGMDRLKPLARRPARAAGIGDQLLKNGSLILFGDEQQAMLVLNPLAALVWDLCDGALTVAEIAHDLQAHFPEQASLQRDVVACLEDLAARGFITWAGAALP